MCVVVLCGVRLFISLWFLCVIEYGLLVSVFNVISMFLFNMLVLNEWLVFLNCGLFVMLLLIGRLLILIELCVLVVGVFV